jgi:hypothetical protein
LSALFEGVDNKRMVSAPFVARVAHIESVADGCGRVERNSLERSAITDTCSVVGQRVRYDRRSVCDSRAARTSPCRARQHGLRVEAA